MNEVSNGYAAIFSLVKVTRLIRTSYGDYQLQTIPPGMAIEVPLKPLKKQKHRGALFPKRPARQRISEEENDGEEASPVQWKTYLG